MKEFQNEYIRIEIKDGILFVTYKKGAYITLEIAKEVIAERIKFMQNVSMPSLGRDEGMKGMDKAARDYLSSDEGIKLLNASALLVNSVFNRFLANFFIKVNFISLKIPVKVFTSETEAIEWLQTYR
jgi:hypothetical protein